MTKTDFVSVHTYLTEAELEELRELMAHAAEELGIAPTYMRKMTRSREAEYVFPLDAVNAVV